MLTCCIFSPKGVNKRSQLSLVEGTDHLRWFVLPQEVSDELLAGKRVSDMWQLDMSPMRTSKLAGVDTKLGESTFCPPLPPSLLTDIALV